MIDKITLFRRFVRKMLFVLLMLLLIALRSQVEDGQVMIDPENPEDAEWIWSDTVGTGVVLSRNKMLFIAEAEMGWKK